MAKTKAKTKTTREVGDSVPKGLTIRSTNPAILSEQIFQLQKMIKSSDEAKEIAYDNTDSGLTAENVQAAIDEVVSGLTSPEASDVTYDNTESGLTADDVQEAIDEVAGSIVKQVSHTATTNTVGALSGASTDFGMSTNALVLSAYVEKTGSLTNSRQISIGTYGAKGYTFFITDNDQPVVSTEVTLSICYVDRKVNS